MASEIQKTCVEIGFLEKTDDWKLGSRFFPSKVGGKPAWLDLENIPSDVNCGVCEKPCIFLCQIYAPIPDKEDCFHRTLFVFICKDPKCYEPHKNQNMIVYRSQLHKENEYYSAEPPVELATWQADLSVEKYSKTCCLCGIKASKHCGKCKKSMYCSVEHQVIDWKGGHKVVCGTTDKSEKKNFLFPQFEVVIDTEQEQNIKKQTAVENLKEYEEIIASGKVTMQDESAEVLEQHTNFIKDDKYFENYKEKLKLDPDQVIRYNIGGSPLYVSDVLPQDIPNCEYCGSVRQFEFQILSTLLNDLDIDSVNQSIDWGTLIIYTCKNSCSSSGNSYKKEFIWKQDFNSQ